MDVIGNNLQTSEQVRQSIQMWREEEGGPSREEEMLKAKKQEWKLARSRQAGLIRWWK